MTAGYGREGVRDWRVAPEWAAKFENNYFWRFDFHHMFENVRLKPLTPRERADYAA